MPVTDLQRVAQYVKSDKTAPSEVYNAACRLLNNDRPRPVSVASPGNDGFRYEFPTPSRDEEMEAMRVGAEKLLGLSLDEGHRADKAEAERDALEIKFANERIRTGQLAAQVNEAEAAIERVKAVAARPRTSMGRVDNYVPVANLWTAINGSESNRDGRTPQTLGATEGQEAGEAQEAAQ
jgi:hypothetical protein